MRIRNAACVLQLICCFGGTGQNIHLLSEWSEASAEKLTDRPSKSCVSTSSSDKSSAPLVVEQAM